MLGNRELQILKYFSMSNHEFSSQDILQSLEISERQFGYSLSKINNELILAQREKISRLKDGGFRCNLEDVQWLYFQESTSMTSTERQADFYIPPLYRPRFLALLLMASSEKVGRSKIQDFLSISKNTAVQDIKKTAAMIERENLLLTHNQALGFRIEGDYDTQRRLLIKYINDLVVDDANVGLLEELFAQKKARLLKIISGFEREFSLRFSDSSFTKLYFMIGVYEAFVSQQSDKKNIDLSYVSPLRREPEFNFVGRLANNLSLSFGSDIDLEWVTLLFLSSNTILNETKSENQKLYNTIKQMVEIFEKQSGIYFKEKDLLVKKLFFHLKPAVYRLRYNIPLSDSEYYRIMDGDLQNKTIYSILTSCLKPFEDYLGMEIPQSEVELISYYFGSELVKISGKYEEVSHLRAGVVCSNGMVVAKIMLQNLRALFPELTFVTTCSRRDFFQYAQEFDVVFTTAPLEVELPCYVIPSVLNKEEKRKLRQRVLADLEIDSFNQKTKAVLEMIKQYADIRDVYELGTALESMIGAKDELGERQVDKQLEAYLNPSRLLARTDSLTWQESLHLLGDVLIDQDMVTHNYISVVEKQMAQEDSYYILGETVAIPHASPEDGVLKEGCAVLISEKPIVFPGDRAVHFVVLLALLDSKNHLGVLNQVLYLSRTRVLQVELLSKIGHQDLFDTVIAIPQKN